MFFTTYQFIFMLLPVALIGFYGLRQSKYSAFAVHWLLLVSAIFYWSLDRHHLATLIFSIVTNYYLARRLQFLKQSDSARAKRFFWICLSFNASFLALFKYVFPALGFDVSVPLGLSFFTLVQIGYHISVFTTNVPNLSPTSYGLMVGYFPYLVAGPVVTRKDFAPEGFSRPTPFDAALFLTGLMLFAMGLFKKVVLADSVAPEVVTAFSALGAGVTLSAGEAWVTAALCPLQLYFDFSGYTDMACGISAMFGFRLPRNFFSPLKAHSIMVYWRRWHMSVTKFFTNNLYLLVTLNLIRFANRRGLRANARFAITVFGPTLICFTLIGVWHGSGANFLWFGLLMATSLSANQLWAKLNRPLPKPVGWAITMTVVSVGMILGKTNSGTEALSILGSMMGMGAESPQTLTGVTVLLKLALLASIVLLCPNSHQILSSHQPVLPEAWDDKAGIAPALRWGISARGMGVASTVLVGGLVTIPNAAPFIYYRF